MNSVYQFLVDNNAFLNIGLSIGCVYPYKNYRKDYSVIDIVGPPIIGAVVGSCFGDLIGIPINPKTLKSGIKIQLITTGVLLTVDYVAVKYFKRNSVFV